jgi:hypothetical protein
MEEDIEYLPTSEIATNKSDSCIMTLSIEFCDKDNNKVLFGRKYTGINSIVGLITSLKVAEAAIKYMEQNIFEVFVTESDVALRYDGIKKLNIDFDISKINEYYEKKLKED